MLKKFLITGGAGFIGSTLIRHIISTTKHEVFNIDKLTYASNLVSLSSIESSLRYSFEQVDICNRNKIKDIFDKYQPDIVIHLAAETHVDRSINGPAEFIQTNIVGTYAILETTRLYWLNTKGKKKIVLNFIMFLRMKFMVI